MSPDSTATEAARLLNKDQVIAALNEKIPEYADHVGRGLRSAIHNETTANLLEIQVFASDDKDLESPVWVERPPANADWVKAFYKWCKHRTLNGRPLRAGIEPISVKACVDASVSYFNSEERLQLVGQGLVEDLKVNKAVQSLVLDQLKSTGKLTKREIQDLITVHGGQTVADQTHNIIASNMHHLLNTKIGITLSHMLAAALTLPVVKVAIMKAVIIALSHAAIQHMLVVAAKHAGITVIAVIFFGSAGASVLSWMLLPIVAGILIHQYVTMPETLAKKITPKVVAAISKQAPEINECVTTAITEAIFKEFFKLSEDIIEDLHEKAMEYCDK